MTFNDAAFTVILPHKRNPGNDAALQICLSCLMDNTDSDYYLMSSVADNQPLYGTINRMIELAPTDCCVYVNSDMFMAPGWDAPMLELYDERTFVTNVLVEPGAIAMHPMNLHKDFGRTPETFRRAEFEDYVKTAPILEGEGWYCPVMFSSLGWQYMGGHDVSQGEFHDNVPADIRLFEKWKLAGNQVKRAPSFTYHLQRYSDPKEQAKR